MDAQSSVKPEHDVLAKYNFERYPIAQKAGKTARTRFSVPMVEALTLLSQ